MVRSALKEFLIALFFLPVCCLFAQEQTDGYQHGVNLFNDYDFDIVENYIQLKQRGPEKTVQVSNKGFPVSLRLEDNKLGWKAIRILDNRNGFDYYLNHDARKYDHEFSTTILTSSGGRKTDQVSLRHFYDLIHSIKQEILSLEHVKLLHSYLACNGTDGTIEDVNVHFTIHTINHREQYIEITPLNAHTQVICLPYRLWEKKLKRKYKIRWQYLVSNEKDLPDDFFYMSFTKLLLAARK